MQQAIAPVAEARHDLDICAALAWRLGLEGYNDKSEDEWLREAHAQHDAGARGIADGQPLRVFNRRGATVLPARVTDRIAPGVVAIKEGAWFALDARGEDTHGCSNMLTPDAASPAGASPFNTCFVEVAPA